MSQSGGEPPRDPRDQPAPEPGNEPPEGAGGSPHGPGQGRAGGAAEESGRPGGQADAGRRGGDAADDPFARLVLDEDFIKSASINEVSARARQRDLERQRPRPAPKPRRRGSPKLRWKRRNRRRLRVVAGSPRRPRPSRMPDWTPAQWVVTAAFAVAMAAYLYFNLGGPT